MRIFGRYAQFYLRHTTMKIRQVIFLIFTISILTSCRRGYKVEGDKVYYETWNEGSGQNKKIIEQADAKTFQELILKNDGDFDFGKDKNHLFINGELINNIDPKTFNYIGNYIFRDKDYAYFFGSKLNESIIKGVNPNRIKLIKYPWARADNFLIHGQDIIYLDDINDFIPIDEDWGKTKKYVINANQILYDADVSTFKVTSSFQGKDKNFNYEFGAISEDDFKKVSFKTFNFDNKEFCNNEPIVFVDICDSLVSFKEDKNKTIKLVEMLKQKGFTIEDKKYLDWGGESKIIRTTMINNKCNCIVEKLYSYDYGKPSETKNIYKITERIHCKPK